MVRELGVYVVVEHSARVRERDGLPVRQLELEVLRKYAWEHAPDTICVELERTPDLLDELPRHLDDCRASETGDTSHLH